MIMKFVVAYFALKKTRGFKNTCLRLMILEDSFWMIIYVLYAKYLVYVLPFLFGKTIFIPIFVWTYLNTYVFVSYILSIVVHRTMLIDDFEDENEAFLFILIRHPWFGWFIVKWCHFYKRDEVYIIQGKKKPVMTPEEDMEDIIKVWLICIAAVLLLIFALYLVYGK